MRMTMPTPCAKAPARPPLVAAAHRPLRRAAGERKGPVAKPRVGEVVPAPPKSLLGPRHSSGALALPTLPTGFPPRGHDPMQQRQPFGLPTSHRTRPFRHSSQARRQQSLTPSRPPPSQTVPRPGRLRCRWYRHPRPLRPRIRDTPTTFSILSRKPLSDSARTRNSLIIRQL